MRSTSVHQLLDRWTAAGLITDEQARRMRADVPVPSGRGPLIVEGVGYLGATLVVTALVLLAEQYWTDLGDAGRLLIVGGATVVLGVAGAAVPRREDGWLVRLRALLWLACCGAVFGFLLLLSDDWFGWDVDTGVTVAAAGTLLCAAGFWALHPHPVQHAATLVAVLVLAGWSVALLPDPGMLPALAIWATGVAWALLAWGGWLPPELLGRWLGAATAAAGAAVVAGESWGSVLAVATIAALIAVAVTIRDQVLLVVAAVAALPIAPAVVGLWFPGVLGAVLALLLAGLLLVAAAVLLARRHRAWPEAREPAGAFQRLPAAVAAGSVLALTAAVVLAAGA
jgi:hypothetical protein